MFSCGVLVIFAILTVTNAGFFHKHNLKHHFTFDINGFHNYKHGYAFQQQHGHFVPPPPVYGPPPFSPHLHGHPSHPFHNHNDPQCKHKPDDGNGMTTVNTNSVPTSTNFWPYNPINPVPFIPNMNNPLFIPFMTIPFTNLGPNFPFNSFFNPTNGDLIPQNSNNVGIDSLSNINNPSNLPANPLSTSDSTFDTNTPVTPLDTNMVHIPNGFNGQSSSTVRYDNELNQPTLPVAPGSTEATSNENNYNGSGAKATDNDNTNYNNQANKVPSVNEPTTTAAPTQGKYNGLDYDIDVRFDGSNNSTNQQQPNSSDTRK